MSLYIEKAGPLSLVQDLGRFGHQDFGVSVGGAMDQHAFGWANKLLGNAADASQVEITMGPFRAVFKQATSFAICGAKAKLQLNGSALSPWSSHRANAGDRLEIGFARQGLRSYLAVTGGFNLASTLGSCSTVVRDNLGGLHQDGKALKAGDQLAFAPQQLPIHRAVPPLFVPEYGAMIQLGVLPSYQFDQFSQSAKQRLFNSCYQVTPHSDRMGYRLEGEAIEYEQGSFISEGIAPGAIQIPANGQPIVLMRDRQTIGGYPKMGCICQLDLNRLAQAAPGTQIQFYLEDFNVAADRLKKQQEFFFGDP